jgi:hypothetical protein
MFKDYIVSVATGLLRGYLVFPWDAYYKPFMSYNKKEYTIYKDFLIEIVRCSQELLKSAEVCDTTHAVAAVILCIKTILQVDYYCEGPILRDALAYAKPFADVTIADLCHAEFSLFKRCGFCPCKSSPYVKVGA